MLSVIIATEGQEQSAVATLSSLVAGAASGVIRDVVLADLSAGATIARVADVAGCTYLATPGPRGAALAQGAAQARGHWLLFLNAGAVLDPTWIDETQQFVQTVTMSGRPRAGTFSYARSPYAEPNWRDLIASVARLCGFPSPDQGLLIARDHYQQLGSHRPDGQKPEADLLRRLGRARMQLRTRIVVV